jgi:hypothetical protein
MSESGSSFVQQLVNRSAVRIIDPQTQKLVMEIVPPRMASVTLCTLSENGRYLLVGNTFAQYFYLYQLYPAITNKSCPCNVPY